MRQAVGTALVAGALVACGPSAGTTADTAGARPTPAVPAALSGTAYWVGALYREARSGQWKPPQPSELAPFEALVAAVLAGGGNQQSVERFAALGWKVSLFDDAGHALWVLQEQPERREGRGFYVLRAGQPGPALQAPHGGDDLHTDQLALQLFAEGRFVAAGWNTVSRRQVVEGDEQRSDLAHAALSYFTAFTRAYARTVVDGAVLQLHGFSAEGHPEIDGGAVVSAGRQQPSARSRCVHAALGRAEPGVRPRLYGVDARTLGGTRNAQVIALRGTAVDFVHLELNLAVRQTLRARPDLRAELLQCF